METPEITRSTANQHMDTDFRFFEIMLCATYESFQRLQEVCFESIGGKSLTGQELSVLQTIQYNNRAKALTDIATMLNRTDTFNIQYCIRKLLKLGFIEKVKKPDEKTVFFQISSEGNKLITKFAALKNKFLNELFKKEINLNLNNFASNLEKIKEIYEKANRAVITSK